MLAVDITNSHRSDGYGNDAGALPTDDITVGQSATGAVWLPVTAQGASTFVYSPGGDDAGSWTIP